MERRLNSNYMSSKGVNINELGAPLTKRNMSIKDLLNYHILIVQHNGLRYGTFIHTSHVPRPRFSPLISVVLPPVPLLPSVSTLKS